MSEIDLITKLITDQFASFEKKIEHFDTTINNHIINSAEAIGDIKLLKNNQDIITKDLQKNFDQHKDFYDNFKEIDRGPDLANLIATVTSSLKTTNDAIEKNNDKTEANEIEIAKMKTSARNAKWGFGVIIAILGLLIKLGVI